MNAVDFNHLSSWIGRSEESQDRLEPAHVRRIAALLDHAEAPERGAPLPPLWHWCFFTPTVPQSQIDPDGHPKRGGFLPPVPLPRRMWAGGRLSFHAPLRVGDIVTRTTEIASIRETSGKQGTLVFLTLKHALSTAAGLAIKEEQDIVYRAPSKTAMPAPDPAPETPPADWRDPYEPDPVRLFRYSALTNNAHRIHYDLPYATQEEGYPGLVVQGPLTATLLMDAFLKHRATPPRSFSFRGQAPLFSGAPMALCGQAGSGGAFDLWAEGPGGHKAMSATVTTEEEPS